MFYFKVKNILEVKVNENGSLNTSFFILYFK